MKKFTEFIKDIITEEAQKSQTFIQKAGNIIWGYLLQPNNNNFIYHTLRNINGQHNFRKIENMLRETVLNNASTLSSLIGTNKTVTLAIPVNLESGYTIVLYPSVIIDNIDGEYVNFHIDPKQYRTIKQKYGFKVDTTSLSLQFIKKHPDDSTIKEIEKTNSTNGLELQDGGKYWYKIYGREKGQLNQFTVNAKCALLWKDLEQIFNTAVEWYDIQREAKKKREDDENVRKAALLKRGKELFDNMDQIKELWSQVKKNKYDARDKFLDTLTIEQLKDIESLAYYRWAYHYEIYAQQHKVAEMADDYRAYSSQSSALQNIRDRDGDISVRAKEAIEKKAKQNEEV